MIQTRQYLTLAVALLLLTAAFSWNRLLWQSQHLSNYVTLIEQDLHARTADVSRVFSSDELAKTLREENSTALAEALTAGFKNIPDVGCLVRKQDSLVYWNKITTLPPKFTGADTTRLLHLPAGFFLAVESAKGPYRLSALVPVKYEYGIESPYLKPRFQSSPEIPPSVQLVSFDTGYPLRGQNGTILAYLDNGTSEKIHHNNWMVLVLGLLGFFFLALFIDSVAKVIVRDYKPWAGAAFLLACIFSIRMLTIFFDLSGSWGDFRLFDRSAASRDVWLSSSLGDLMINISLLLWIMVFFYRQFQIRSYGHLTERWRYFMTTLYFFSMVLGVLMIALVFKNLVKQSGIVFDFDNVFNLDIYSVLAILCVVLTMVALYLFSYRIMLTILDSGLSQYERIVCQLAALAISVPVIFALQLELPFYYFLLSGFVFLQALDFSMGRIEYTLPGLFWWLIAFSIFSASLLYSYNEIREEQQRKIFVHNLAEPRDSRAESLLRELNANLAADSALRRIISAPFPFRQPYSSLLDIVNRHLGRLDGFSTRYQSQLSVFDAQGNPAVEGQPARSYKAIQSLLSRLDDLGDGLWNGYEGVRHKYILAVRFEGKAVLFLEFEHQPMYYSQALNALKATSLSGTTKDLDAFDYALYVGGQCVESHNYPAELPADILPAPGTFRKTSKNDRTEILYHSQNGKAIAIAGKTAGGLLKIFLLFSYIFTLLILLTGLFFLLNTIFGFMPGRFSLWRLQQSSLQNIIQLSSIALIFLSFLAIGVITGLYFLTSSNRQQEEQLDKTLNVLVGTMEQVWQQGPQTPSDSTGYALPVVASVVQTHKVGVNLFDNTGRLLYASDNDLYARELLPPLMDGAAYKALRYERKDRFYQQESIGTFGYRAAYAAIRRNNEAVAYLELPRFASNSRLQSDVSDFIGTLLIVNVFMLLIAFAAAVKLADYISNPLSVIGEKLKNFKLGKRNERLVWHRQDEIGQLVSKFNLMMDTAEAGAVQMVKEGKEDAWREMAQQVAHEIKNPLTPMKLSIQYLMHKYSTEPDTIGPVLTRVSNTLIEQIDGLSEIASEFSMFAKMPVPQNSRLVLNHLVDSVCELFKGSENVELTLFKMTDQELEVMSDKNQLMRVLNNLIKNAIQSIPSDRKGKVSIYLYRKANQAMVRISDNGVGIPEDNREKIFKPYFTTKGGGTGLGLAICKNIVEAGGGKIYFETETGKGTDFYISLPLLEG